MKTSLVMCSFNRQLQLKRGLETILSQEVLPGEILVIDDGSVDGTKEMMMDMVMRIPLVRYIYLDHPEHRISSIPRNVGIKQSKGDLIMFTEPECLHVGNTIKQLLEKFEEEPDKSHLASQVWTIQRKIYEKLTDDNFKRPVTILGHHYAQLTDNTNMQNTKAPDSDWAITGQTNCTAGCLFGVKRQWLEDICGFDESFEGFAWDDFDLFARLAKTGHGIIKHDNIIVIHQWHEKNYPYNIYEMGDKNGKKSEENIKAGRFVANVGKEWGQI